LSINLKNNEDMIALFYKKKNNLKNLKDEDLIQILQFLNDSLERIQNFFSWIDDQDFEDFKVIQITPWDNDLNDRFIDYGDWKDNPFNLNLRCTLFYEDPDREVSSLSSFS
jgi:hypothetical protein